MFHELIKKVITSAVFIYTVRCLLGFCIGYYFYIYFEDHETLWTIISIILVISPEGQNSKKLSIERFKSNLVGSVVGLICLELHTPNLVVILFGILLTILICYFFKILNMARVALVSLVIILVQPISGLTEMTPLWRFLAVTIGCLIGLLIVIFTSIPIRRLKRYYDLPLS
ncbi:FUSC family protein [Myroides odoratus]|uniref:FUSC family protein n=1 Tax=Myroides odoratus TaxID=256 RepID=UPI000765AA4F|nr:FUSC family protein [Myroides odoratus]